MNKIVLSIIIIFLITYLNSFGANTPEEVIKDYCRLDAKGYALSGVIFNKKMLKYITDQSAERAPGWDIISVIQSYNIEKPKMVDGKVNVLVRYHKLGELSSSKFNFCEKDEKFIYELVSENSKWKINKFGEPKVMVETGINHLQNLFDMLSTDPIKNKEEIALLKISINKLIKIKNSKGKKIDLEQQCE